MLYTDSNGENWVPRLEALEYRLPIEKWASDGHVKTKVENGVTLYSDNDINECSVQFNKHQLRPNETDMLAQEYEA